ncbi:hypothetical protein D0866_06975 [Hortaea werneckii]|uniref:NADH dehydrogenase [ubiquinone] 1 alpha subcomplex assembly factor 3 n=1 Tax=Hortaea werneckii TaxID=91943 RepID=A0A3M7AWZ4_HORWE|nr:hypothetical protein D0866_06975 [Hortaea werneckii]
MRVTSILPQMAGTRAASNNACRRCFHQALSGRSTRFWLAGHNVKQAKCLHASATRFSPSAPPKTKDRGPASKEDTQTDFNALDILSTMPAPSTAIDTCMDNGFALNSGLKVTDAGVMLVGGEAFKWRPWAKPGRKEGTIGSGGVGDDTKGLRSDGDRQVWGVLDLCWPRPDLLVLGTGPKIVPVSPETRRHISELGIRLEVQDTRNAAAQFNLLATERGMQQVVAALVPIGWREGK